MKKISSLLLLLLFTLSFYGQNETKEKLYNPEADAALDVKVAVKNAKSLGKHALVMIGFNECPWCVKLNDYIISDPQIDSLIRADYIWVKVNYSKENKNLDLMKNFGFPQRMGFPVIVILDHQGKRMHTQNTWYLEEGKSYNKKKIMGFLKEWNVAALDIKNYKDYQEISAPE